MARGVVIALSWKVTRALCHEACGNTGALPWWVACSVTGHVATPEPSGTESESGVVGLVF
jgi:hypothetical protein